MKALPNDDKSNSDNSEYSVIFQQKLEQHLHALGEWRFNTINGGIYHKPFKEKDWQICDDRMEKSIRRYLKLTKGLEISHQRFKDTVGSDFSIPFDPIVNYLEELDEWSDDLPDYIEEYSSIVKTSNDLNWKLFFKKWLIGVVANVYSPFKCKNHHCITLIGNQGDGKSTFLNGMFPKSLMPYCFTGTINFKSDFDVNAKLSQNLLLHIEEILPELMQSNEDQLKEILTRDFCNYCRKFENQQSIHPRLASFMASLNKDEFLTDASGDRRFLVFRVLNIELDKISEFDVDGLWAQAVYEYKNGYEYWFEGEMIDRIHKNNEQFRYVSEEQDRLSKHFDFHSGADAKQIATHHYTATALLDYLREHYKDHKMTKKSIGVALKSMGLRPKQSTTGERLFYVTPKFLKDGFEDNRNDHCDDETYNKWRREREAANTYEKMNRLEQNLQNA